MAPGLEQGIDMASHPLGKTSAAGTQSIFLPDNARQTVFSTRNLPADQKDDFWIDCIDRHLIGLSRPNRPYSCIDAELSIEPLSELSLNRVRAGRHAIQRSAANIHQDDRELAFMSLMLKGEGYVEQEGACCRHRPGDVFVYNSYQPYFQEYRTDMDMMVVSLPRSLLASVFGEWNQNGLIYLDRKLSHGGYSTARLFRALNMLNSGDYTPETIQNLMIEELYGLLLKKQRPTSNQALMDLLLRSKDWIRANLQREELTNDYISHSLKTSKRQLARAFELEQTSVSRFIWNERLHRCHQDLLNPNQRHLTVSEIAFRWGFNHPAHFSRSYKQKFGESPKQTQSRLLR